MPELAAYSTGLYSALPSPKMGCNVAVRCHRSIGNILDRLYHTIAHDDVTDKILMLILVEEPSFALP